MFRRSSRGAITVAHISCILLTYPKVRRATFANVDAMAVRRQMSQYLAAIMADFRRRHCSRHLATRKRGGWGPPVAFRKRKVSCTRGTVQQVVSAALFPPTALCCLGFPHTSLHTFSARSCRRSQRRRVGTRGRGRRAAMWCAMRHAYFVTAIDGYENALRQEVPLRTSSNCRAAFAGFKPKGPRAVAAGSAWEILEGNPGNGVLNRGSSQSHWHGHCENIHGSPFGAWPSAFSCFHLYLWSRGCVLLLCS